MRKKLLYMYLNIIHDRRTQKTSSFVWKILPDENGFLPSRVLHLVSVSFFLVVFKKLIERTYFAADEKVFPFHSSFLELLRKCFPDLSFVSVDPRAIEMSVTNIDRILHGLFHNTGFRLFKNGNG